MTVTWKTFRVSAGEGAWEPASCNFRTDDGREYERWPRVLPQHPHGVTVISYYKAPPGKAWKIVGKASELGEEVYILWDAYYMHGATFWPGQEPSCSIHRVRVMVVFRAIWHSTHCCSGGPDEIVSIDVIDFEPKKQPKLFPELALNCGECVRRAFGSHYRSKIRQVVVP